jgi:hypothetical protein
MRSTKSPETTPALLCESSCALVDRLEIDLVGFALADCVVEIDRAAAKYLKAVHRTALELASPNCFGMEIGGFWLMIDQLTQLRKLPDFYPLPEGPLVARAVEAYIKAQVPKLEYMTGLRSA